MLDGTCLTSVSAKKRMLYENRSLDLFTEKSSKPRTQPGTHLWNECLIPVKAN